MYIYDEIYLFKHTSIHQFFHAGKLKEIEKMKDIKKKQGAVVPVSSDQGYHGYT